MITPYSCVYADIKDDVTQIQNKYIAAIAVVVVVVAVVVAGFSVEDARYDTDQFYLP